MAAPTHPAARETVRALKARLASLNAPTGPQGAWPVVPFGDPRLDARLPGGGLARGRWHELAGAGPERECPAAAAGFAACLAKRLAGDGAIIWALARADLYAPGLAGFGLDPDRLIYVQGEGDAELLAIMEDALRTRGVGAVIGEVDKLDLAAGKRLALAAARFGAAGLLLRRALYGGPRVARAEASAAMTRWRIAPAPSATDEPGLGPARWRVALERCRGGREGAWLMEADDVDQGAVRVVAELADHAAETHGDRGERARPRHHDHAGRRAAPGGV